MTRAPIPAPAQAPVPPPASIPGPATGPGPAPQPPPTGERNRVVATTFLVQAINTWAMLSIAAMAPLVADGLGLAAALIGYQISLIYAAAALTSLKAGAVIARWGAAGANQISLGTAAGGVVLAATGTLAGLALASVVIGVGYALTNPASSYLLFSRTTPRDRSFVFSLKQTGVPLGGIAAGLMTPALAVVLGWQAALLAVVGPALAVGLWQEGARRRWDAGRPAPGTQPPGGAREVLRIPGMRALGATGFLFGALQLCLMGFVVTFAVTELGFGVILAGWLLAVTQVAGAAGRLGWGVLADALQSNRAVLVAIGVLSTAASAGFGLLDTDTPRLVVFALAAVFGACAIGWNGVFLAEVARQAPEGRIGTVTGTIGFLTFGGVVLGPAGFVLLHAALGSFGAAFAVASLSALAGTAMVLATPRPARG